MRPGRPLRWEDDDEVALALPQLPSASEEIATFDLRPPASPRIRGPEPWCRDVGFGTELRRTSLEEIWWKT